MSQQRIEDTPGDWRRRRGRGRQGGPTDSPDAEAEPPALAEQSRTLFSFIEPVFDFITVFYAPILIAASSAWLQAPSCWLVGSLKLYGGIVLGIGAVLVVLVGISYFSQVLAAFFSRTGRYGVNTVIMTRRFYRAGGAGQLHRL